MTPIFDEQEEVVLFTGNYGSGKTEVAVNVAEALARDGRRVTIADLDLVNPYFRCREAREPMEELGIRVIAPEAELHSADLPILLPHVRGAVEHTDGITLLDVGGDNVGATVLASLAPVFRRRRFAMHFVLNRNRPFTGTVAGAMTLMDEIEAASKLAITHVTGNTHLMEETTLEMAREGAAFCRDAARARARNVKTGFVTCPVSELAGAGLVENEGAAVSGLLELDGFHGIPVLPLRRIMLPPWLGGPPPGTIATHSRDRLGRLTGSKRRRGSG
ncbi:MAG: Adenylyl-sulfate kinase [Calditrichaeota bacterium]|nr:Adenylyl-sulfate kinase [Calditrichota bacterium]